VTNLGDIEGIAAANQAKLGEAGVTSVEGLLERGATPKGREELAAATGISGKLILKWVNHADLFRIKGVAGEYAELLEAAGVDTTPELAQRNAENLHAKMVETNSSKHVVRQVPSQSQVAAWIAEAKQLPRIVTY
jgi:predicted flap endonuclease-1-like 5' DNA nuclease